MPDVEILIIGGGISGAVALHRLAAEGADVLLLEQRDVLGGVIRSERNARGVLIERGPNSTQLKGKGLTTLVGELGLTDQMVEADSAASKRYILRNGTPVPLPSGPPGLISTPLFSAAAKFRLLRELFVPPAPADAQESIAEFVERRLGREVLDYAVNPFISGIYAGRPEELAVRYAFPRLYALEQNYGGLIRGMVKGAGERKKRGGGGPAGPARLISFREGMAMLPQAIERRWADHIRAGVAVESLEQTGDRWLVKTSGDTFSADKVLVAVDAGTAAGLIKHLEPEAAAQLRRIHYPPVATAVSLYRREDVRHPLDGFGMLIPEVENRSILGVIFSSTIFPDRAPAGTVVLTTFIGGARQPQYALADREDIQKNVEGELRDILDVSGSARMFTLHVWPRAIPQYGPGHGELLQRIADAEQRRRGMFFLGNYRGGISVGDCIESAEALVKRL